MKTQAWMPSKRIATEEAPAVATDGLSLRSVLTFTPVRGKALTLSPLSMLYVAWHALQTKEYCTITDERGREVFNLGADGATGDEDFTMGLSVLDRIIQQERLVGASNELDNLKREIQERKARESSEEQRDRNTRGNGRRDNRGHGRSQELSDPASRSES